MNFIFISPQFPSNYWNFCAQLKNNGVNVLGISDASYDSLKYQLKSVLTEYYKVENLEDYNQVMKAVAYFTFKYGKIDWLESNNEYWLEQDAKLRTDFHIITGFNLDEVQKAKYKSIMKELYQQFQIPTAPYVIADNPEKCRAFAKKTGYPIVVKPDRGMKIKEIHLLNNETDLEEFLNVSQNETWIMEQYINGSVWSYDAIINSNGTPVFESGSVTPVSALDIVNQQEDVYFYILKKIPEDLKEIGRRCVEAFHVKSRFIHFEFFHLNKDQDGVGKKGDFIALKSNMCPRGGYVFDMLNYANSTDVYRIWASMVAFDDYKEANHYDQFFCCLIARRDDKNYIHSHNEVLSKYRANITLSNKILENSTTIVGGQTYLAKFAEETAMKQFVQFALSRESSQN
ncbi:Carbamoyl-phosphate synthase large chain [Clostridiales bacterium CHKCI001]|nr:Carbamoyl-phosphate synthase large chain [Clostridiales bacterium CHKCI001]